MPHSASVAPETGVILARIAGLTMSLHQSEFYMQAKLRTKISFFILNYTKIINFKKAWK